jgi:hypothetical protein
MEKVTEESERKSQRPGFTRDKGVRNLHNKNL